MYACIYTYICTYIPYIAPHSPMALYTPIYHHYTTCTSCDKRSYKMWGWVQTHDMS